MKRVTFLGHATKEYAGVVVEGTEFPLDDEVVVKDALAEKVKAMEDFRFSVKNTSRRSSKNDGEEEAPDQGGFGGDQGSQSEITP